MANVLRAFPTFDTEELGFRLHDAAAESERELRARHLFGVIQRYATNPNDALRNTGKGTRDHWLHGLGHFAVVDDTEQIRGSASVIPNLPLDSLRYPLPPIGMTARFKTSLGPRYTHNIAAWTVRQGEELLAPAYQELIENARYIADEINSGLAWTIEPRTSPDHVQDAIRTAGMQEASQGWYDDRESGRHFPAWSILYEAELR